MNEKQTKKTRPLFKKSIFYVVLFLFICFLGGASFIFYEVIYAPVATDSTTLTE